MKTLVIISILASISVYGIYELVSLSKRVMVEQKREAIKVCDKNNFKGWVKLKGNFNVYKCLKDTKSVEVI